MNDRKGTKTTVVLSTCSQQPSLARVKGYSESQTGYLAVTVIVVVEQEPTYPAGRLSDVILWPPRRRDAPAVLSASLDCSDQSYVGTLVLIHVVENATLIIIYTAVIIAQRLGKGDSPRPREFVAFPGKYFVSGSP